ncbi:MAG TPA: hypothetical protein VFS40_14095 [Gemmatimonadales bacterium]|nr:hypothetical protein [Gemmatimonadales bacterium]
MLRSVGFAVLVAVVGTAVAAAWTFVLGLAGAPGGRLSVAAAQRDRGALVLLGAALTFLAQTYLALAFAGAIARWVVTHQVTHSPAPAWPLWLAGWYVAAAPAMLIAGDRTKALARWVRPRLAATTLYLAVIGFWVFVRWPGLFEAGWAWVPPLPR